MSYRKKHLKTKIGRIKPKKSIFKKLWFWIIILFFAIALSVFYFVFFYSGFQLKNIVISGNDKVKTQDLQPLILNDANTGLINFGSINIISKSIFLIDNEKIKKDILKQFPVIENVLVSKKLPQTLILSIAERKPIGIFCSQDSQCFLIDNNGIIFETVPGTSDNLTTVRQSINNNQVFTGEQVVAQNMIGAIDKIQKNLKDNFNIDLTDALVTSPVRLNVTTNEKWQIYFDLGPGSNINLQLTKLNLLLNGGISSESRKNLRYVDLRPQDRAVFCDNPTCGMQ